ncbi:flagellar basal body P-ring formation chaperone FlgA [Frateuria defendens]|uniref:flagellar basal body P-ring formation chaperone FlgA n=1 Tax=Frateuria defendens TaxID=2219559 RepID=UPI00066FC674|nr:flagellar basal body P-ring formation chaperone FlgA [Frateuria defendens]
MRGRRLGLLLALAAPAAAAAPAPHAFAQQWLAQHFAQPGSRVEASAEPLDPRVRLAPCAGRLEGALPGDGRPAPRMSVLVHCTAPGGWTLRVPVSLKLYRSVLVASRPLQRGDGVVAGDVHAEERDVTRLGYGYLDALDQLAERSLARPLAAGSVLTPAALGGRQMVRAGDRVQLLAELDSIAVRAEGVALGSGDSGARLRVRNANSGRVVDALVRAPGEMVALP